MFLAGDVGGTKTRVALFAKDGAKLSCLKTERFDSKAFPGLAEILTAFLKNNPATVEGACFGVPGPVIGGTVKTTNLPWILNQRELGTVLSIPRFILVNDLVATAASVTQIPAAGLECLNKGEHHASDGPTVRAVLAPGTGTGQGFLISLAGKSIALPSEGGHIDYSPTDELQRKLLTHLSAKYNRVSVERVLCGPGLFNIYSFLRDSGTCPEPKEVAERLTQEDPGAVISQGALENKHEICIKALDLFVTILGCHAGNVVLTYMATGGIYLGGGIPPKILPLLKDETFLNGFFNKGRFSDFMKKIPVHVIKDDTAALWGAASIAADN